MRRLGFYLVVFGLGACAASSLIALWAGQRTLFVLAVIGVMLAGAAFMRSED